MLFKKKFLSIIVVIVFVLCGSVVGAQGNLQESDFAAYVFGDINLSGTSIINGDVVSGSGNISLTELDGSNYVYGDIYVNGDANVVFFDESQYGSVYENQDFVFGNVSSEIFNVPEINNYISGQTSVGWYPEFNVVENTYYESLKIQGPFIVDVSNSDKVIRVGNLELIGGGVYLKGGNSLFLIVDSISFNGSVKINPNESGYTGNKDNMHLFILQDSISIQNNIPINGSIYVKEGNVEFLGGGSQINGNIVVKDGRVEVSGNTKLSGVVYAPNSGMDICSSGKVTGRVVVKSLDMVGKGSIDYNGVLSFVVPAIPGVGGIEEPIIEEPEIEEPEEPVIIEGKIPGIVGEYYDTLLQDKETYLRMVRVDNDIVFSWQEAAPSSNIEPDTFSIRWTGYVTVPESGDYSIYTLSDDGVRMWVGDTKIIDRWQDISLEFTKGTSMYFEKGVLYPIKLEYFENYYNATIFLFWESDYTGFEIIPSNAYWVDEPSFTGLVNTVDVNGNGLYAEYFDTQEGVTDGSYAVETRYEEIGFHWLEGSPHYLVPDDYFSVRWSGSIKGKYSEMYTLDFVVDDGIRVWIDDALVIDSWQENSYELFSTNVWLENNELTNIKVEYKEYYGQASCLMYWSSEGQEYEIVPSEFLYGV